MDSLDLPLNDSAAESHGAVFAIAGNHPDGGVVLGLNDAAAGALRVLVEDLHDRGFGGISGWTEVAPDILNTVSLLNSLLGRIGAGGW